MPEAFIDKVTKEPKPVWRTYVKAVDKNSAPHSTAHTLILPDLGIHGSNNHTNNCKTFSHCSVDIRGAYSNTNGEEERWNQEPQQRAIEQDKKGEVFAKQVTVVEGEMTDKEQTKSSLSDSILHDLLDQAEAVLHQ